MKKKLTPENFLPLLKEIIENGGIFPLVVTGTSMTPTLYSDRDTVNLVSPENKVPRKYDVVLFVRNDGKFVLHRIIKVLPEQQFLINGDSQTWTEIVDGTHIIAVVESFSRKNRFISCSSPTFRIYSRVWCLLRPVRPFLFRCSAMLKKFLSRNRLSVF